MEHVDVLIIGAGISGIGMACRLCTEHPGRSFTVLEGRQAIGGTWDLFRYPGVRSDSDMYTFGYDFKPWKDPKGIAAGDAILEYLRETVEEYGLLDKIRFGHRVHRIAWSSQKGRWTASGERADGSPFAVEASFLVTGTGYYNYEHGYAPSFEGVADYRGVLVHPQHWPEDLDYGGKDVLVIGSGATAVTLVPAMAQTARHVTMLQRTPTYVIARPATDGVARVLRRWLPERLAYKLVRWKNIGLTSFLVHRSKTAPAQVRAWLRDMAKKELGPAVDVDVHFNPPYAPWDQRLCLDPDAELFHALRDGSASVLTDRIKRFTRTGVELESGQTLDADVVVTATGLDLQFLGGAALEVDGRKVESQDLITYRGAMFAHIPNWVAIIGYTAASWTLRADLSARWVCRLLRYLDEHGYDQAVPVPEDEGMPTEMAMTSLRAAGYVQRAADVMPKQGLAQPWRNNDNYLKDLKTLLRDPIEDGVLQFRRRGERVLSATAEEGEREGSGRSSSVDAAPSAPPA